MPKDDWKPNHRIVKILKKELRKMPKSDRIAFDGRILTWKDVIKEIRNGTKFGRRYYLAFLESMIRR